MERYASHNGSEGDPGADLQDAGVPRFMQYALDGYPLDSGNRSKRLGGAVPLDRAGRPRPAASGPARGPAAGEEAGEGARFPSLRG